MAPTDGSSSRFHPYDKTANKKPSARGKQHSPRPREQQSSGLSVSELKRRIRDVKRLLNHADLTPAARIVQERALAGYEKDLKDETERRQRSELIKRYHFVRFLERKAATKELRRLTTRQRELDTSDPKAAAQLTKKIHEAQINVNYTIYYPLSEKYISLYPHDKKRKQQKKKKSSPDTDEDEEEEKDEGEEIGNTNNLDEEGNYLLAPRSSGEKPPMWHTVEKCTADKTLDLLREGKLNIGADGEPKEERPSETPAAITKSNEKGTQGSTSTSRRQNDKRPSRADRPRRNERAPEPEPMDQDGDESDGGFFEE